ncbi:M2 family metallopeptidase [Evansella cellulosilytica]|uniref:Peptidase M3A and M3B thimet/oligopeptidase F n=1 Tax=Evansella cellulosilytica (strain ATCC 21833 / DSM 2522 / FERM P-1141 / JCM 9156 / N-4) TaxID=649639 RepID=E6TXH7_EVAC2|nr:M2 family metallopeptidase [Evansella cellulosilytica]ADU28791.1 peptidase M3A and M3B thimet/oligopeptidase F [Evansella cellulosilytica DSM 2522]
MAVEQFLQTQNEKIRELYRGITNASWKAQTTGDKEWAQKVGEAQTQFRTYFSDKELYETVTSYLKMDNLSALQKRQLEALQKTLRENQLPKDILKELSQLSAELNHMFNTYAPEVDGKKLSANDIRNILLNSDDVQERENAWKASKEVGQVVEGKLLTLVRKRNEAAKAVGFDNYHQMSFKNQELDREEIFSIFQKLIDDSDKAFRALKAELDEEIASKFNITVEEIRPWHYVDPFFQEAPASEETNLDPYFKNEDLNKLTADTFSAMGIPIDDLYAKSDLLPREGKNPTAFCTDMDREGDTRVLCNNEPNAYWMGTMLHEFGHAAYFKYLDRELPFILRSPAHTLTTEAIAMLFGKMTQNKEWLKTFLKLEDSKLDELAPALEKHEQLMMLIAGRWIITFVFFEKELYENPEQDLNGLWWKLVSEIQLVNPPEGRDLPDWAAKIHFTLAPVYYQNYLLGELTSAQLHHYINKQVSDQFFTPEVGQVLNEQFFKLGSKYHWNEKIERVTGEKLNPEYFSEAYCKIK